MEIGTQIRKERRRKEFTIDDLCYVLNWSPSKLSKIENGVQRIRDDELIEIAEALQAEKLGRFTIDLDYQSQHALIR